MKRLILLPLLLAGCVDFVPLPTGGGPRIEGYAVAGVGLSLDQPVDGPDTLRVNGQVGVQTPTLRFVDDTLRVLGRALRPKQGQGEVDRFYDTTLVAPGPLAGAASVVLPVVEGVQFVPATFQAPLWVRSGPARITLAKGADLVLPLASAPVPAELATDQFGNWSLRLQRGQKHFGLQSTGDLPERVVVPAALVPDDTARFILAELTVSRGMRRFTRSDSTRVYYQASSRIWWSVEVVPAAP